MTLKKITVTYENLPQELIDIIQKKKELEEKLLPLINDYKILAQIANNYQQEANLKENPVIHIVTKVIPPSLQLFDLQIYTNV